MTKRDDRLAKEQALLEKIDALKAELARLEAGIEENNGK